MKDTSGVSIKSGHGIHVDVDLALVNVTVTDPYDRPVTGLDPSNFRVFENNIEQEVLTFSMEDSPISVGIIFDNSGSMADKFGPGHSRPAARAAVGVASSKTRCSKDFSIKRKSILGELHHDYRLERIAG